MSEMPMEKTETSTPTSSASCCARGVAPTRKPVFKSCDVLPALAEAMQTTPPMLMASAAKAAPVQCSTRKTAQVAIRVAMAMPEIGFEDVPMSPVMREETAHREAHVVRQPCALDTIAEELFAGCAARGRHVGDEDAMPGMALAQRLDERCRGARLAHGNRVDPDSRLARCRR